jgi:hypothetical protein
VQTETVTEMSGRSFTFVREFVREIDPNNHDCEVCRKLRAFDQLLAACCAAEEWINEAMGPSHLLDQLQSARAAASPIA